MSHQSSSSWAPPTGGDELRRLLISGLPADVKPRELLHIFGSCPGFESSALVPHMASVLAESRILYMFSFIKAFTFLCIWPSSFSIQTLSVDFRILNHAASRVSNIQFDGQCGGRARQISGLT
jgi:hypothetical protein